MVCLIDKKQWILKHTFLFSSAIERTIKIVPNLLSVEHKRSPNIFPESRAFKNLSPHISPTTREEICCKVPIKSPYSPTSARGSPLGEADDKCISLFEYCFTEIHVISTERHFASLSCNFQYTFFGKTRLREP